MGRIENSSLGHTSPCMHTLFLNILNVGLFTLGLPVQHHNARGTRQEELDIFENGVAGRGVHSRLRTRIISVRLQHPQGPLPEQMPSASLIPHCITAAHVPLSAQSMMLCFSCTSLQVDQSLGFITSKYASTVAVGVSAVSNYMESSRAFFNTQKARYATAC